MANERSDIMKILDAWSPRPVPPRVTDEERAKAIRGDLERAQVISRALEQSGFGASFDMDTELARHGVDTDAAKKARQEAAEAAKAEAAKAKAAEAQSQPAAHDQEMARYQANRDLAREVAKETAKAVTEALAGTFKKKKKGK